jgi:nucleoside-diphosphate kinase
MRRLAVSSQRTLLIIKPDAVAKNAIGNILMRLEADGFVIRELRKVQLTQEKARQFYEVHKERPFYGELVEFMTSGPAVPTVLERDDAVAHLRQFIGETDSTKAAPGTIRAEFGTDVQCNAVHASDSPENAANEIKFFFG